MSSQAVQGYEVVAGPSGAVVKFGKFQAGLETLEECGVLFSPAGRAHTVPAWIINEIAVHARQVEVEHEL